MVRSANRSELEPRLIADKEPLRSRASQPFRLLRHSLLKRLTRPPPDARRHDQSAPPADLSAHRPGGTRVGRKENVVATSSRAGTAKDGRARLRAVPTGASVARLRYRTVHGYRRAFRMAGNGPAVLLIHGIGDSSD